MRIKIAFQCMLMSFRVSIILTLQVALSESNFLFVCVIDYSNHYLNTRTFGLRQQSL